MLMSRSYKQTTAEDGNASIKGNGAASQDFLLKKERNTKVGRLLDDVYPIVKSTVVPAISYWRQNFKRDTL